MTKSHKLAAKPINRGRAISIVSFFTLIVAACGYLREAVLAAQFGLSATMDAYFAGVMIPNVLYLVLVAGTLSPVFVPMFLQAWEKDKAQASEVFSVVTTFMIVVFSGITFVAIITARWWIAWIFPGFDSSTLALALRVTYIAFPAVLLLALAGISSALLNSLDRFALAAFSPAISSCTVIAAVLFWSGPNAIYFICIATALGFLLQFAALLPATISTGVRYRFILDFQHPSIRKIFKVGVPLFAYLAVGNASALFERALASQIATGAVSAVNYAIRLFAVPSNLLAAPLAVVTYTQLARHAASTDYEQFRSDLTRAIRLVTFAFLPISLWVVAYALPITRVIYEHGEFGFQNSIVTSRVLMMYSIGILPNALAVIALRGFYAIQDTLTPLVVEILNLILYVLLALFLTEQFGLAGLAATRGLTFFLSAGILLTVLEKRGILKMDFSTLKLLIKTLLASTAAVGAGWVLFQQLLGNWFAVAGAAMRGVLLCSSLGVTACIFFGIAYLLRIPELHSIRRSLLGLVPRMGPRDDSIAATVSLDSR